MGDNWDLQTQALSTSSLGTRQRWLWVQQADNWHTKIPERALRVNAWFGGIHFVCAFVIKAGDNEWFPYICQYLAHWRISWIYFNAQAFIPLAVFMWMRLWDLKFIEMERDVYYKWIYMNNERKHFKFLLYYKVLRFTLWNTFYFLAIWHITLANLY